MARYLTDGKESCIPKTTKQSVFTDRKCKICDCNVFVLFDDSFLCCKECGTCASILSHPYDAGQRTYGIGFKMIPRKRKKKGKGKAKNKKTRHDVFISHYDKVAKDYKKRDI